MEVIPLKNTE